MGTSNTEQTITILAGGQSRRMGRDKAQIAIGHEGLLARTARIALQVESSVLVVGRSQPGDWSVPSITFVEDEERGQGPLGGLATALRHTEGNTVLLLACDMPRLTADALLWLLTAGESLNPTAHGLVTLNGEQHEPLFSLYAPSCLPLIEQRLAEGRRSLHGLIEAGRFQVIAAPPEIGATLVNVNTPEEWAALGQSPTRSP